MTASPPGTYYIAGPTAVGKSDIAVAVAERLDAEILGCDAYQVYRGLPILTAQPEQGLLDRIPHHLIGEIPLSETLDVARYLTLARQRIAAVHARGKAVVVVGGTGMYLRALTRGLAELPASDPALREDLETMTPEEHSKKLKELDPVSFETIDLQNPRRVIRALEVCILTGKRFSDFREEWDRVPENLKGAFLQRPREELTDRINRRVVAMFDQGVIAEVAGAGELSTTSAQALGLREIQQVISGELSLSEAMDRIQAATRQYAKRQATWFRKETWMVPVALRPDDSPTGVAEHLWQRLK